MTKIIRKCCQWTKLDIEYRRPCKISNYKIKRMKIYDNKKIRELLGINDKLLKKYRDNGLLGYSRVGDKYWYSEQDIEKFLSKTHIDDF